MIQQLQWRPSTRASALHIAFAITNHWPVVNESLMESARHAVESLDAAVQDSGLDASAVWESLLSTAHQFSSNLELVTQAVRRSSRTGTFPNQTVPDLAERISQVEKVVANRLGQLESELRLRERPIRELWESRGPGLLRCLARTTHVDVNVQLADIVLVHPTIGGFGQAHPETNSVRLEALLTNVVPGIPEVSRLGWLLAQIQIRPHPHDSSTLRRRLDELNKIALLVATLHASHDVELIDDVGKSLPVALNAWGVSFPSDGQSVSRLTDWWNTFAKSSVPWTNSLMALGECLEPSNEAI